MPKVKVKKNDQIIFDEIKKRAHEIFMKRIEKKENGDELSDWVKAKTEVKNKFK